MEKSNERKMLNMFKNTIDNLNKEISEAVEAMVIAMGDELNKGFITLAMNWSDRWIYHYGAYYGNELVYNKKTREMMIVKRKDMKEEYVDFNFSLDVDAKFSVYHELVNTYDI